MYCSQIADSDMHPECMERFREIARRGNGETNSGTKAHENA
jgi:hypothetical protein